jgi:6-methylsalicylic acid synthase
MRVPVAVTEEQREIQVVRDGDGLTLASRSVEDPESWLIHVTGRLATGALPVAGADPPAVPLAGADPDSVRAHLTAVGVPETGFVWAIRQLRRGERELVAVVCLEAPGTWAPAIDAALSIAPVAFPGAPVLRVVAHVDRVEADGTPPSTVHIGVTRDDRRPDAVDITIAAPSGAAGVRLAGVRYAVLSLDPGEADLERPAAADPFAGLSGEPLRAYLRDQVGAEIAAELRLPTADLDPRRSLVEQGLDSVLTMVVRRRLERRFGLRLPATLLWQQPTVAAIARHLAETAAAATR